MKNKIYIPNTHKSDRSIFRLHKVKQNETKFFIEQEKLRQKLLSKK